MQTSQQLSVTLRARLRKSRHGCQTCKQRKIKCDEARPVCGNCARRYYNLERCDYPSVPVSRQRQNRQLPRNAADASPVQPDSPPPTSIMTRPTGASANQAQRQLEMRLMYHYTQFAALELPATYGYTSKELWLDKVPQMAFESDILLDSLLTVAALHMQDLMPEDPKLGMAVNHYLDRTLTKHRYSLGCIDKSLAEPLFLTAFMLCITSWQLEHRRSLTSETYRIPANVFAIVRGCCALHRQYDGWLAQAGYDPKAIWSLASSSNVVQTDHPLLRDITEDIEKLLEASHVSDMPADDAEVYRDTAECVLSLYRSLVLKVGSTILQRLVFTMAVRMKSQYVTMLVAGEPLALALYARILTVLGFIDHLWWSRGSSNNRDILHYSINGISNMMPTEWSWAMEWPLKVVSREITLRA
ncbi:putative Zn2 Cys6 DNA-binding protein [Rosellinia necatrix]|uniref:Putative Zn2 Cys6 DNA-binding protein n=1 Tax=Rosellinia necatrix TaxID=77044 RepID=A0A1S7ULH1_ROSNE|nr:putative Zn2 Cys6 DNA-binding protein [Rosellinia necatrix]